MPTGYTYGVQKGEITTLEDFAKTCARAFLWQARDSDEKDLLKLINDAGSLPYYQKELKMAEDVLAELESLDDAAWQAKWEAAMVYEHAYIEKYNIDKAAEALRYIEMIDKVKDWVPPTDKHTEMKSFMLQQLEDSLKFDCEGVYRTFETTPFEKWKSFNLNNAQAEVTRYRDEVKKHSSMNKDFVGWVNQLLESVKGK